MSDCKRNHNDRGNMTPIFKVDALVGWVCKICLNGCPKKVFDKYILDKGFTVDLS